MEKPVIMAAILQSPAVVLGLFKPVIELGIPTFWLAKFFWFTTHKVPKLIVFYFLHKSIATTCLVLDLITATN